ncbi:MAG: hypothetical protein WCK05_04950 [Planctomycetota bacterium]
MRTRTGTWMWAVAAAMTVSPAWGQVMPVQGGGALDANPGLGAYNQNSRLVDTRVNSQLYIDGQVTGLARFHGNTGYKPLNEFQGNTPSADLRNFTAQSVGVGQVLGGTPYITSPYYTPSTALLGGQVISSGKVRPGLTVVPPPPGQTYYRRLYTDAVESFRPLLPQDVTSEIALEAPLTPRIGALPIPPETTGVELGKPTGKIDTRLPPMFIDVYSGMASPAASMELARQLYEMQAREARGGSPIDTKLKPAPADVPFGTFEDELAARKKLDKEKAQATGQTVAARGKGVRGANVKPSELAERPANAPQRGEDVFLDILELMAKTKAQDDNAAGEAAAPGPEPRLTRAQERQEIVGLRLPVDIENREIRVHSLAGRGKDQFNALKREGQAFLQNGQYYDAVNRFQDALIINPDDPTGHVGLALATFGAGELRRSAVILRTAMERFPGLMQVRFDLLEWLNTSNPKGLKALEDGINEINARLIEKDNAVNSSLAALGAWIQLNVDKPAGARRFATILKEAAPKDPLYQAFANHILAAKQETPPPAKK